MRRLFIFAAAAVMMFSCKPEGGGNVIPKPDDGGDQLPENLTNLTVYGKVLDENGQPYPGVVMTDGYNFTETDAEGFYRFEKYRYASFVQCSLPPEAAVSTGGTYKLPDNHYKRLSSLTKEYNFTLRRQQPEKRFRILALGDPQVHNASQVARYRQTAVNDIRQYVVNAEKIPTYDKTVGGKKITITAAGSTGAPWKGLILSDGCQRGYKVYEYDGTSVKREVYKSIQYEEPFQMRLFRTTDFPSFTSANGNIFAFPYFGGDYIAVNVFNYKPGWKVVLKENGAVTSSNPVPSYSFDVWAKLFMYNYHKVDSDVGKNHHMLYFKVKDPKSAISVEVTDEFGATFSGGTFTTTQDIPDYDN